MELEDAVGRIGEARLVVSEQDTAIAMGSGDVPVLATPRVLALAEQAAVAALDGVLDEDVTSVGAWVTLEHRAPNRVGDEVRATAEVTRASGHRVSFSLQVRSADTLVAVGEHRRSVVDRARFGT